MFHFSKIARSLVFGATLLGGVFAASVASLPAFAQLDTGTVTGSVLDPSGAAVQGASVTVTNLGTNGKHHVVSDAKGVFFLNGLSVGVYTVTIEGNGFQPFTSKLEVTVGAQVAIDARLSISKAINQVEVSAEGGVAVNTETPEVSQVISSEQITQLPSLTRNPYDFVGLSGNVSSGDAASSGAGFEPGQQAAGGQNATLVGVGYNINGQRSSGTEILLDGLENNEVFDDLVGIPIPLDAVDEYRVITSNFQPQYGRASGGVVNVVTKAGSNSFHGSAWEFNRLSAYTANTFYDSVNGIAKGGYTRNQFGYVIGGPVKHDKLFFLNSVEWTRVRSSATETAAVITPQLLALSSSATQAFYNQYTASNSFTFANTTTLGALGYTTADFPTLTASQIANTPSFGVVHYQAPVNAGGGSPQNAYNVVGRLDYNLSDRTQIFGRYVLDNVVEPLGSASGGASPYAQYDSGFTYSGSNYQLNVAHQFATALALNSKLGFSRLNPTTTYNAALVYDPELYLGSTAELSTLGASVSLPGLTSTSPYGGPQNTVEWNEDLSWIKSRHNIQVGTAVNYIQLNRAFGAYAQAEEQLGISQTTGLENLVSGTVDTFTTAADAQGKLPCVQNPYTGALSQTAGCTLNTPVAEANFARSDRYGDWAAYAQDSWKATPRLSLDYGVRYEFYGVQHNNKQNLDSNFYYGSGSNYAEQIANGQVLTAPKSSIGKLWKPSKNLVSPRVGFAWDPFGHGKDSVRGGFGTSFERNFGNVTFNLIQNPPSQAVLVVNGISIQTSNLGPLSGTGTSIALPPTSLRNVDQNIKTAQTQFWSLSVEHQLAPNAIFTIQYLGAHGVHLYDIKDINGVGSGTAELGTSLTDTNGNFGLPRLNPQFSDINNRGSNGSSIYHALNLGFQASNIHQTGLSTSANFTWGHSQDDLSTTFSETNSEFNLGYTDPFNPKYDWGNSDLDIQKRLVLAPVYETPWFKGRRSIEGLLLGGWIADGIFTARSGAPINYFDSSNNAGDGYNIPRYTPSSRITKTSFKNAVAGGSQDFYTLGYLPAAQSWANPAYAGTVNWSGLGQSGGISNWGPYPAASIQRNSFRGPGAWNLDAAVAKKFVVREQVNVEFRAEGFNVLNHHNFYAQEGYNDVANTGYGTPIPVYGSKGGITAGPLDERRFGQFALKVNF